MMCGRSQYLPRDQRLIAALWLVLVVTLFTVGSAVFVTAATFAGLLGGFLLWMCGLILFGMCVEWWQR